MKYVLASAFTLLFTFLAFSPATSETSENVKLDSFCHVPDVCGLVDKKGWKVFPNFSSTSFLTVNGFGENVEFVHGMAPARQIDTANRKTGYISPSGRWQINPSFQRARPFSENGLASVKYKGKYGYINTDGKWHISPRFDQAHGFMNNGLALVKYNGKWGMIDIEGSWSVPAEFDRLDGWRLEDQKIENASGFWASIKSVFSLGDQVLVAAKFGEKWGYLSLRGKWIIDPEFDKAYNFLASEEAKVQQSGKWGIIDRRGRWVVNPRYDDIREFRGRDTTFAKKGDKWGIITREGSWLKSPKFDRLGGSRKKRISAQFDGKWGVLNPRGDWIIRPKYDSLSLPANFTTNGGAAKSNGKWGIIDARGNWFTPPIYQNIKSHSSGVRFSAKIAGKWGHILKNGDSLIKPRFDWIGQASSNGLVPVTYKGRYGVVSKYGKWVVEPASDAGMDDTLKRSKNARSMLRFANSVLDKKPTLLLSGQKRVRSLVKRTHSCMLGGCTKKAKVLLEITQTQFDGIKRLPNKVRRRHSIILG